MLNVLDFFSYSNPDYHGQDATGPAQYIYIALSLISIVVYCFLFRKTKEQNVIIYLRVVGLSMAVLELFKMAWETISRNGDFPSDIWPLYTCSLFIYLSLLAGFAKSDGVKRTALAWLVTIGAIGGFVNIFSNAGLRHYPWLNFGAFQSMLFHYLLAFTSVFLLVTRTIVVKPMDILLAMIPMGIAFVVVIPYDYLNDVDYMQVYSASGVPLIEDIGVKLAAQGLRGLVTVIMIIAYLAATSILVFIYIGIDKLIEILKKNREIEGNQA